MSADQKLDQFKSSVQTLNSTVEELKSEQNTLKSTLSNKIREVCHEMFNTSTNNNQIPILPVNSQSANSFEASNTKKRLRQDHLSDVDENDDESDFNREWYFREYKLLLCA